MESARISPAGAALHAAATRRHDRQFNPAAPDLRRALQSQAFAALIDATLAGKDATGQRSAAADLIASLETADLAKLAIDGQHMLIRLCDTQATSTGGPTALLRNWQHNATARLQAGIRR